MSTAFIFEKSFTRRGLFHKRTRAGANRARIRLI
jgi:hypothetical protein